MQRSWASWMAVSKPWVSPKNHSVDYVYASGVVSNSQLIALEIYIVFWNNSLLKTFFSMLVSILLNWNLSVDFGLIVESLVANPFRAKNQ